MGRNSSVFFFLPLVFLVSLSLSTLCAEAYKNYTVGDSLGWYDTLENPKVDYQKWASNKNFSLGDFLIFNTDNNHSVIQTYNFTIYKLCDDNDARDNETIEWSTGNPSSTSPQLVSVAVPLSKVGMTYFFSSDYDGEQCENGQQLKINVTYGQGLPRTPSDESPGPISPQSGDDVVPDTIVPANFDNPQDIDDGNDSTPSKGASLSTFGVEFYGLLIVVGFGIFYI